MRRALSDGAVQSLEQMRRRSQTSTSQVTPWIAAGEHTTMPR